MRTALRTAAVLALTAPLVAPALPASAATSSHFAEKGSFAEAFFEGAGTPANLPGNYTIGQLSLRGSVAEGFVETWECEQGETPGGDESEENGCEPAGSYYAWGEGVTIVQSKGRVKSSTYSGTVGLYVEPTEEDDGGMDLAAEDVPFDVTFTFTGRSVRSTFTESFRDPESGESYRFRETRVFRPADVQGSLDGIDAVEGVAGRYSLRYMERVG
jgi:hypothetical protein